MSATKTKLVAYHNDHALAKRVHHQVEMHYQADEIIQGQYWDNGKGCAIGCIIHGSDHAAFETMIGVPREIAYLLDGIFEALANDDAKELPRRFVNAIKPGADLSMVITQFLYWMLAEDEEAVVKSERLSQKDGGWPQTKRLVDVVVKLYEDWVKTGVKPANDFRMPTGEAQMGEARIWEPWEARLAWEVWEAWVGHAQEARIARQIWEVRDTDVTRRNARNIRARRNARNIRAANKLIELLESAPDSTTPVSRLSLRKA